MSTTDARLRPRCSWPRVASRRLSWVTARCTAARSWVGLVGRARSSSASGRDVGSCSVRSISPRSSSRRRWRSKRATCSRSSVAPPSESGRDWVWRPSVRRMRCTSTPITPEPSPRRPKAAIASRARSRISPSLPSRSPVARPRAAPRGRGAPSPRSAATRRPPVRAMNVDKTWAANLWQIKLCPHVVIAPHRESWSFQSLDS